MASESQGHGHAPVDKSKKYDRQLRLWGDHGQNALETSKVCLINATATGTEILKNLILPGVGVFTIVDGKRVSGEDLGNNFFLDKDSIGKSRAQVTTELLQELNEDVNGDFLEESPESLIESNPSFFTTFTVVIATSLPERSMLRLSSILWDARVPLLVCTCYGFTGYMRLAIKEHTVIESHPDNALEDLRLDNPFPSLVEYCDSLDLEAMSKKDHSHTPWLVVIYKFLQIWRKEHEGNIPRNYREKNSLKEMIRQGIRKNDEGVPEDEENFDEAITNVNTALIHSRIPSDVRSIFDDPCCANLHADSKAFWIMARALKEFVSNEGGGCLPLRGSIPDMTSDSERYIKLQNVYRDQANQDIAAVSAHIYTQCQNIGRGQEGIMEADIRSFCKNASFLRVLRTSSLQEEHNHAKCRMQQMGYELESEDSELVHYVMLRAVQRFYASFNQYPGYHAQSIDGDIPRLKMCVQKLLAEWNLPAFAVRDDFIQEYCRFGAAELHSVSAFIGGAAAQEVIKLLTGQFVPLNNTYIYNAAKQTSSTFML